MATHFHPYVTPAVQQLVLDAGLEIEAGFWTHNSSAWTLVNQQFKNLVCALDQHKQPLTPGLCKRTPAGFDFHAFKYRGNTSGCAWWGKRWGGPSRSKRGLLPGQPGYVAGGLNLGPWGARYHGGLHPRVALDAHIKRQVQMALNRGNPKCHLWVPWYGRLQSANRMHTLD